MKMVLNAQELEIIKQDAFIFLKNSKQESFDFIFADPPYDLENRELIAKTIIEKNILKENGIFVLEHSSEDNYSKYPLFKEERKYGSVHFSIFNKKSNF